MSENWDELNHSDYYFFKKAVMEQGIPFQVSTDPFYSETNQTRIREAIARLNAGIGTEHGRIEADE